MRPKGSGFPSRLPGGLAPAAKGVRPPPPLLCYLLFLFCLPELQKKKRESAFSFPKEFPFPCTVPQTSPGLPIRLR